MRAFLRILNDLCSTAKVLTHSCFIRVSAKVETLVAHEYQKSLVVSKRERAPTAERVRALDDHNVRDSRLPTYWPQCTPGSESPDCPRLDECLFCYLGVSFGVFESRFGAREQENREQRQATLDIPHPFEYRSQAELGPDSTWMGDHLNDKYAVCC
jgi:hypothetical protein